MNPPQLTSIVEAPAASDFSTSHRRRVLSQFDGGTEPQHPQAEKPGTLGTLQQPLSAVGSLAHATNNLHGNLVRTPERQMPSICSKYGSLCVR